MLAVFALRREKVSVPAPPRPAVGSAWSTRWTAEGARVTPERGLGGARPAVMDREEPGD